MSKEAFFDAMADSGFIRVSQLVRNANRPNAPAVLPFSQPTLWRKVKAGTFPKPVSLGDRMSAWRVSDVREWITAQASAAPEPIFAKTPPKPPAPSIPDQSTATMRDQFAGMAMQGMLSNPKLQDWILKAGGAHGGVLESSAYAWADAMLKERSK